MAQLYKIEYAETRSDGSGGGVIRNSYLVSELGRNSTLDAIKRYVMPGNHYSIISAAPVSTKELPAFDKEGFDKNPVSEQEQSITPRGATRLFRIRYAEIDRVNHSGVIRTCNLASEYDRQTTLDSLKSQVEPGNTYAVISCSVVNPEELYLSEVRHSREHKLNRVGIERLLRTLNKKRSEPLRIETTSPSPQPANQDCILEDAALVG